MSPYTSGNTDSRLFRSPIDLQVPIVVYCIIVVHDDGINDGLYYVTLPM